MPNVNHVESRGERTERILARLVPQLTEELDALYYYLEHLPGSLQPTARNYAFSLRQRMSRIHNLLEGNDHGDPEREAAGAREVEELKQSLREGRAGSPFEEFHRPPRGSGRSRGE